MSGIVEIVRHAAESGGRDRFSCSLLTWHLLLELGQVFGWQPRGTTYLPRTAKQEALARHNYEPGDPQDYKRVEADDAIAWAAALERAKVSPHLSTLLAERAAALAQGVDRELLHGTIDALDSVIGEFIVYAFGGAFAFASRHSEPQPTDNAAQ